MSFTLRISGTAFEQKLVGFKDIKTFKEKLKNQNDEFFYEILDEEPEDAKEISHQYVVSANSEIVLLDKDRDVVKTFEVSDLRRMTPVDNLDTEKLSYKGYAFYFLNPHIFIYHQQFLNYLQLSSKVLNTSKQHLFFYY